MALHGTNLVLWHRNLTQVREDLQALRARGYDAVAIHHTRYVYTRHDDYPIPRPAPAEWGVSGTISDDCGQDPEHPKANTPHPTLVRGALTLAKRAGFKLIVDKPSLDLYQEGSWRGFLTVKDVYQTPQRWDVSKAFLEEYWLRVLKPEAEIARSTRTMLSLGCELRGLTQELGDGWLRDMVARVRKVAPGIPLTYSANWGDEALKLYVTGFWQWLLEEHPGNRIGIDLYKPLASIPTSSAATLERGMQEAYDTHRPVLELGGSRVMLTEFGYPAIPEAAVHPEGVSEGQRPPMPDYDTQTACFRAWAKVFKDTDAFVWMARGESGNDQHDISLNPEAERAFLGA